MTDKAKEEVLLEHFQSLPKDQLDAIRGSPEKVLAALNNYCTSVGHFMNIGMGKGGLIVEEIKKKQPKVGIELGGYLGFSLLLFSPLVEKYYSFELEEKYAKIMRFFIDLAELKNVEIIVGSAKDNLAKFVKTHDHVDFAFIDHWDSLYLPDFKVLEELKLVQSGTLIVADNVKETEGRPGAKEFQNYVQNNSNYESYTSEPVVGTSGHTDQFEVTKCI